MLLISANMLDLFLRYKAPVNTMYNITGINFSNFLSVSAELFVYDYLLEDDITDDDSGSSNFIATFNTAIAGTSHFIDSINHKTKFITIGKNTGTSIACQVQIYGDIVPVSKTDLLIEWFRKGR